MWTRIIASIVTFSISFAVGVVFLFGMLIAMNGYSEGDAVWGLGVYAALAVIVAGGSGVMAYYFTGVFVNKEFSPLFAVLTAVSVFAIVAVVLEVVAAVIGVGVAEIVRVNF